MSLKLKLFSGVFSVAAFAAVGIAQDVKETPKDGDAKVERKAHRFEGRGMRHGGFRGMRLGKHGFRGIELTEAQKTQIKQIREANKPDASLREEMKTIMQAKRGGTATAEQEARLQAIRTERKAKAEAVHAQIQSILTAEQKAQIEQRKVEMKSRMQELRQRMQERRQMRGSDKPAAKPADVKKDN